MIFSEKKKCPVCEGIKVIVSRPSIFTKIKETIWPFRGESKTLNTCSGCNFSWED